MFFFSVLALSVLSALSSIASGFQRRGSASLQGTPSLGLNGPL